MPASSTITNTIQEIGSFDGLHEFKALRIEGKTAVGDQTLLAALSISQVTMSNNPLHLSAIAITAASTSSQIGAKLNQLEKILIEAGWIKGS